MTLFLSVGRRPTDMRLSSSPSVDRPEFLQSIAGIARSPVGHGGTIELLENGRQIVPAMLDAIRRARETVHFSAYIWEPGVASTLFTEAFAASARRGVQVRVLVDGFGGLRMPDEDQATLRAAGVQVATFRKPAFGKLTRYHLRNHRRAIVIDGVVGFTGGVAMGDKWLGDAETADHWRDTMVKVTGPPAAALQSAFADTWAYSSGEILVGEPFFRSFADAETSPGTAPLALAQHTDGAHSLTFTSLASAPSSEDHPMRLFFLQTFSAARQRLWITTPYFVPDATTRAVVAARARAGVDVRLLLPDEHTDAKLIRLTSHHYLGELLDAGVRVYEYQPTMLHTKQVVVDGQWSVVGSANMDIRSKELNHENVLGILDPAFARTLEQSFLRDLARSTEISPQRYHDRSLLRRAEERAASMFSEQY